MALADIINSATPRISRKVYMKRRLVSGNIYETNWIDISQYVLDISELSLSIDDERVNSFMQGGFTVSLLNNKFQFASEKLSSSLFSGYLTRHRTKIKVDVTYTEFDGTEHTYSIGSGFVDSEGIEGSTDGTIIFPVLSPTLILDETPADYVNNGISLVDGTTIWYNNATVSSVVAAIYNLLIAGQPAFTDYYSGLTNTPKNDELLDNYDFNSWTCLLALKEMAEASQSCFYIDGNFNLIFKGRTGGASVFTFNSSGQNANIYEASGYNEGVRDLLLRVQWNNTNPPVFAEESNKTVRDSLTSKYGVGSKNYVVENRLVTTTSKRQTMVDDILREFGSLKERITLTTKFVPQLNLLDTVYVNYAGGTGGAVVGSPALWGKGLWGKALWGSSGTAEVVGGIKIKKNMLIVGISHDVKSFVSTLTLKET